MRPLPPRMRLTRPPSIQNLTRTMVPRENQDKINYTQKVDFAKLRAELTALHGNELNPLKTEQERLSSEISRLTARLREEVQRAQSSVKLDLNLEKGRIREESSVHELKVKETDTRIEKEVGDLRGMLESVKFSTLQWLIGVCTVRLRPILPNCRRVLADCAPRAPLRCCWACGDC